MIISVPGLPPPTKSDRLRALLVRCHDDPSLFNSSVLGSAPFWWRQEEMARMVVRYHTTVFPEGNATGKTWWDARLVLWWLCTRYNSLVVTTAPTHDQLDSALWKNLRLVEACSLVRPGIRLNVNPLRARLREGRTALGIATTRTERISGHHSETGELLVVVEEASGIEREIVDGIDSLGATRLVLTGNPIRHDGPFRELYEQGTEEARVGGIPDEERVVSLRVPSTDSPDAGLPHSVRGLASGGWLRRMWRKYGKESPWCRAHIDARFPDAATAELFPTAWLDATTSPELVGLRRTLVGGPVRLACDFAEGIGRDSSVIVARDNLGVREVWVSNDSDLERAADQFARMAKTWNVREEFMSYDRMGIGKPFGNRLAARGILHALPYAGSASGGRQYANLRTACAWTLRQRLDPDHIVDPAVNSRRQVPFHIPPGDYWPLMREDLRAMRGDSIGKRNRLETRLKLCARLGRSPDRGDALIQTFATEALGRVA